MDIKAEYNAPRVVEETWKVSVNGRLVGFVREKGAADIINGAVACREALRQCLEALESIAFASETAANALASTEPEEAARFLAARLAAETAIATGRRALGEEGASAGA